MEATLKRKHSETEVIPKRKGAFQEGSYPEHYYPIGENYFVLVTNYTKKTG